MKRNKNSEGLILAFIFMMLIVSCSKVDEEQERKDALIRQLTDEIRSDSLNAYITWMQNMGTRFALAPNHRSVAARIRDKFKSFGYENARLDSFQITKVYKNITYQQWQYNVIAVLTGSEYPDSVCVMGAHYDDHLLSGDPFAAAPGANDNASGTAAALEVARVFKLHNFTPEKTIEFIAFGAEELGLYGSNAYATNARQTLKKISFMLNNDMIAYQPGSDKTSWVVNMNDYDNSHGIRIRAEQLCSKFTPMKYRNDNTYNRQSDSYPFFTNNFRAIFFASNIMDTNYHTMNDKVSNCNIEYCREIVALNCAFLIDRN